MVLVFAARISDGTDRLQIDCGSVFEFELSPHAQLRLGVLRILFHPKQDIDEFFADEVLEKAAAGDGFAF
jgi:hypothetical protein